MAKRKTGQKPIWSPAAQYLPIVSAGAIMTESHEGRLVPVLIVDCTDRPDVAELVRVHEHTLSGDVTTIWGRPKRSKTKVSLFLGFERPMEVLATLVFDLEKEHAVIDQIVTARGFFLRPGKPGDSMGSTLNAPQIHLEVPADDFVERWNELLVATLVEMIRRRDGRSKREAHATALEVIERYREMGRLRMKRQPGDQSSGKA